MPEQPRNTTADQAADDALLRTGNGYYYGTTKGDSKWRRYTGKGWLSRGNAELVVDINGVHFRRKLSKKWLSIPRSAITEISTGGRGHAGKWTGAQVIRIRWTKDDQQLVSGFSVAYDKNEVQRWVSVLEDLLAQKQQGN
jgi:hypothetical protein